LSYSGDVTLPVAFAAGVLSMLSPCVLVLLPPYIAYIAGTSLSELKASGSPVPAVIRSLPFIAGFSLLFILYGASASLLGRFLLKNQVIIRRAAGIAIIIFGLHTTGIVTIPALLQEKKPVGASRLHPSTLKSLVMGMSFAAGWTPCVGPILGSILLLAGAKGSLMAGIFLLSSYSLGMAVSFFLIALTINRSSRLITFLAEHHRFVQIASGALLALLGFSILTDHLFRPIM